MSKLTKDQKTSKMTKDQETIIMLWSIVKQLDVKGVDYEIVATELGLDKGHSAYCRWHKFATENGGHKDIKPKKKTKTEPADRNPKKIQTEAPAPSPKRIKTENATPKLKKRRFGEIKAEE